ncbi:uncharacterized protein Z519_01157 [Cladophialophora bantiana CBS 173.52]|uniref:Uncharacterized protein n=1 Tax=Cladophialophora bantiana (strain ATCC 10958 / CBS 173.52 / CDC B-1940 / NIH 8579) TaxID=1442370 RepID=A0A0D2HW56_CLAB1|nr:uncharacterized protein Z519_01157 [Cladophialophora bantiana CBS 173.52]KIW97573.1 hypothetical protein Z519_01157 [Cladophialophora bantiana CBS 173.52]
MLPPHLGFLIHVVIEVPACLSFALFPSRQLGMHTPHAHAVIRQYAALILASVLVAMVFANRPPDDTAGKVAAALAVYHVAPSIRSANRLARQARFRKPIIVSEAFLYLVVHVICFAALLCDAWSALYMESHP